MTYYTPIIMSKIENTLRVGENVEKLQLPYIVSGNVK